MSDLDPGTAAATSVNVVEWSHRLGHDQGQLRGATSTILTIGGQRPVDGEGRLLHEGDTAAQVALVLDNITDVVLAAGMTVADLAHLRIHATSRAALLDAQFVVNEHLAEHRASTPVTAVEVQGLAIPGMEVEIDGIAVGCRPSTERKDI